MMQTLRDIEEPVWVAVEGLSPKEGINCMRFFLNERSIELIRQTQRRVEMDEVLEDSDSLPVSFAELGCRLEFGCESGRGQETDWLDCQAPEEATLKIFYDGITLMANCPVSGQPLMGEFIYLGDLQLHIDRFNERLRRWRADQLGAKLDSAMGGHGEAQSAARTSGPSPL